MTHKKKMARLAQVSLAITVVVFGIYMRPSYSQYYDSIIWIPLFLLSLPLPIIFMVFYFLPDHFYKSWKKFTLWFIPLIIILTIAADPYGRGGFELGVFDTREDIAFGSAILYSIITALLIIFKSIWPRWRKSHGGS